jgi:hypothetical protein
MSHSTTKLEVAMLRIVLALRRTPQSGIEDTSARIARDMQLDPLALRSYVAARLTHHTQAFVRSTHK